MSPHLNLTLKVLSFQSHFLLHMGAKAVRPYSVLNLCAEVLCSVEVSATRGASTPICHVKPSVGRITSLKLVQKGMKIKMLANEHIYPIIGSYLLCSSSHLPLGDADETPCLPVGFSIFWPTCWPGLTKYLMLYVFFWHFSSVFLNSSLYLSFPGRNHQDSRADL